MADIITKVIPCGKPAIYTVQVVGLGISTFLCKECGMKGDIRHALLQKTITRETIPKAKSDGSKVKCEREVNRR